MEKGRRSPRSGPGEFEEAVWELQEASLRFARAAAALDKARFRVEELAIDAVGEWPRSAFLDCAATLGRVRAAMAGRDPERVAYEEYIRTSAWLAKRNQALQAAGWKCQVCGTADRLLEVHHNSYERLGAEDETDVVVLCDECHSRHHGTERPPKD